MTTIAFANGSSDVTSVQMLTGGKLIVPGRWAMQVRYAIQYVPQLATIGNPAFHLDTHPATAGGTRQRLDGPAWNSRTPALWNSGAPTVGWSTFTFTFTVGAIDEDAQPGWAGTLLTEYQDGGSVEYIDPQTLSDWPLLISNVRMAKS